MSLLDMSSIVFISNDAFLIEIVGRIGKRLGAYTIKSCTRSSQALLELSHPALPSLIIEDVRIFDESQFFPNLQEHQLQESLNSVPIPVPVFALISPKTKEDVELIQKSNYIGYEMTPINESLFEQKIREVCYKSYFCDQENSLQEIVQRHITDKNFKAAYNELLPTLNMKPREVKYLLLYATILLEKGRYEMAERVAQFILKLEAGNLQAKNILFKICLNARR